MRRLAWVLLLTGCGAGLQVVNTQSRSEPQWQVMRAAMPPPPPVPPPELPAPTEEPAPP